MARFGPENACKEAGYPRISQIHGAFVVEFLVQGVPPRRVWLGHILLPRAIAHRHTAQPLACAKLESFRDFSAHDLLREFPRPIFDSACTLEIGFIR